MRSSNRYLMAAALVLALSGSAFAQTDVTSPGDTIVAITASGDAGSSPANEPVTAAIDNDAATKYLNFDSPEDDSGFIVTPSLGAGQGGTIVTGLRITAANDAPARDPLTVTLEGATSATGPFTSIYSGTGGLDADPGRNTPGATVNFANTAGYTNYRFLVTTIRDETATCCTQMAEVELLGTVVPEPASFGLFALGGLALLARRRRA